MAKQSTYTGMGATLVKGAGELYRSSNKSFAPDVSASIAGATQHLAGVKAARQAKLANIESKAANYIGQMESMDSSIVDEAYRGVAEEAFMDIKNDYWETTMMLKNMDTSHPDYMETRSHLNQLNSKAKKIASVFSDLAKNKKEELSFISNRNYSAGNDPNKVEFLNNVLTGSSEIKIDEGGNVLFKNNDNWTSYENLPDIAAYDATSFDSVLTTLDGASKLNRSLTDTDRTLYESKIKALLKKGGKNTAISLGSDDFIVDGGMGLGGEEEYDANPDAYQQRIVDSYMNLFENAANESEARYKSKLGGKGVDNKARIPASFTRLMDVMSNSPEGPTTGSLEADLAIPGRDVDPRKYKVSWNKGKIVFQDASNKDNVVSYEIPDFYENMWGLDTPDIFTKPTDQTPTDSQESSDGKNTGDAPYDAIGQ